MAHGKGYRQVQTLFGHLLQIVGHYFKRVLRAVGALAVDMIRPHENYNRGAASHHPDPQRYPLFQAEKGCPLKTSWRLAISTCASHLCCREHGPTQDSRILAHAVHSSDIHFPEPDDGKYYLVDSGFAHRSGYMAPYKGSDVRYHFQEFHDHGGGRRRFRNARKRMLSYSYRAQIAVVVAVMGVHNFLRCKEQLDEGFRRADEVDDEEVEVELPDEEDKAAAEENAVADENVSWTNYEIT
ncbi:uncharacterized protein LOC111406262 [Olea europaea var. sylvestris]|uniref:uncharacterized protein LOC111406262 n=1 Tax=Olea europaea var. sylvestris TaxID=158386 RepID=UPI000C1D6879|nr:uncharacterized protein LOC111406262 [Olea europaea var. sylvestris]